MNQRVVIGLDIGTTACKAVAVDARGRVVGSAARTYPTNCPSPGTAEQDVRQVWSATARALREMAEKLAGARMEGMALSGAMHSLVEVSSAGVAQGPATVWSDSRASAVAARLRGRPELQGLYRRTGCPLQAPYHPARLRQYLRVNAGAAGRRTLFVGIKDWVLHRLTGCWATDLSLASATGLLDLRRGCWDPQALTVAGVGPGRLPEVRDPGMVVGAVTPRAASRTGLPPGLPVVIGASDGALANVGAGVTRPGEAVVSVGTSGAVRVVVERPLLDRRQRTWCYLFRPGVWLAGGAINNGGLALQWVCERFYGGEPRAAAYGRMWREAAAVPPGAEGLVMLPYLTGERSPVWSPDARASLVGLTVRHGRAHVARAAMEAVAFCIADVWRALRPERLLDPHKPVRLTGAITQVGAWAQILADVLGRPLDSGQAADASALGAAILGRAALGLGRDAPTAARGATTAEPVIPGDAARRQEYRSLYRRWGDIGQRLGVRPAN